MMIDKIGGINPLENLQHAERAASSKTVKSDFDSIAVSNEAKEVAQDLFLQEVAEETPDVRNDLVARIKEKIKDPNYINDAIIASVADRIMVSYGL